MSQSSLAVRAVAYVTVATVFAAVLGYFYRGSVGGGLVLGFSIGLGVAIGLFGYEAFARWRGS